MSIKPEGVDSCTVTIKTEQIITTKDGMLKMFKRYCLLVLKITSLNRNKHAVLSSLFFNTVVIV